jgi:hypothetical protein
VKTLLGVTALVIAAGAVGYFAAGWGSDKAVSLGPPPAQTTTQAAQSTTLPSGQALEVWFAQRGRLVETLRTHAETRQVATAAVKALLDGPDRTELAAGIGTQIPLGTRLNSIAISNGVARIDLSSDYQNGGSPSSLQLRLAQVVYTLTQFPTVSAVRLSVDGEPVVDHAVGRDAYRSLAPAASPLAGSWRPLPRAPIAPRAGQTAVWTGRELLVLGEDASAAFSPQRNAWRKLGPHPGGAVWTGKQLLAWGPGAPISRPTILAWAGRELIGWSRAGGAAYRPTTRRWRRLPAAPFLGGSAWTGRDLIVVSGSRAAAFRPGSGWRALPAPPEPREGADVVWDGSELLVVGGDDAPAGGFAYDPMTSVWRAVAPMESGRAHAAAVWTGTRLLVWGGETGRPGNFVIPPHGLAYDPRADRWSPLPQAPLKGRLDPLGVWTGRAMIVWGGVGLSDGAAFTPTSG